MVFPLAIRRNSPLMKASTHLIIGAPIKVVFLRMFDVVSDHSRFKPPWRFLPRTVPRSRYCSCHPYFCVCVVPDSRTFTVSVCTFCLKQFACMSLRARLWVCQNAYLCVCKVTVANNTLHTHLITDTTCKHFLTTETTSTFL